MSTLYIFGIIGLVHCILYFAHTILASRSTFYINALRKSQLEIELLRVKWFSSVFNDTIKNCTRTKQRFWCIWFDIGVCVTLLLLPVSIYILIKMLTNILDQPEVADNQDLTLKLMLPGFDIPISHLGYYLLTLLLCSTFHEFGHAISAFNENVQMYGIGFILFFIFPVAYVQLNCDKLMTSSKRSQLRIMCSGIWHNCVLSALAFIILSGTFLYKPFYFTEKGVSVRMISPHSPLIGPTGLELHDTIFQMNDCSVKNDDDFHNCIVRSIRNDNPSFCAAEKFVKKYHSSKPPFSDNREFKQADCCDEELKQLGHLCFETIKNPGNTSENLCLPARSVITKSKNFCSSGCGHDYCLKPLLENETKIVQMKRLNKVDVLFIGHPVDIAQTILVSNWVPKYSLLSAEIPETITLICKYIVMFSSGLAVINVIPCFFFDGEYIIGVVVYFFLQITVGHQRFYATGCLAVKILGTSLLLINVLNMLYNSIL